MSHHHPFRRSLLVTAVGSVLVGATMIALPATAAASGTRLISASGTASFGTPSPAGSSTGVQSPEIRPTDSDAQAQDGPNRNHSGGGSVSVGAVAQPRNVTTSAPELVKSFDGLNHFDQRFGVTSNQFSVEPPDQGLCVGGTGSGTRVLETVNDVMGVYDSSGNALAKDTLNHFFGYAPAIIRGSTPVFGPFVTDPSCLYDAPTGKWFVTVLTIDTNSSTGDFVGTNHLDIAVSNTSDPAGTWTVYRVDAENDGTNNQPDHKCSGAAANTTGPCFGDYPHIGADANGFYVTTNEYSFFGPEFHGAQIYAFSKSALAANASTVPVVQFDTHNADTFGFARNGFTVWPSVTPASSTAPGVGGGDTGSGGTEWFLSNNAAAEAHDTGDGTASASPSTQLLVWSLTNTSSLNTTPALTLAVNKVTVGQYAPPPSAAQKSGNQPLRTCLNNNSCSIALNGIKDPFAETSANLDSLDGRMQQTTWVNGRLWGAAGTALNVSSAKQAGIEWFSVNTAATTPALANQGYLALGNDNLIMPALAITASGTGVMAFTLVGSDFYPSAGYATVGTGGVGAIHIAAAGQGPEDGFSNYKLFGATPGIARPRWGDYGAAVAAGGNVWMASEYIGQSCNFSQYVNSSFRCGNTRTALANWATRISLVTAPTP